MHFSSDQYHFRIPQIGMYIRINMSKRISFITRFGAKVPHFVILFDSPCSYVIFPPMHMIFILMRNSWIMKKRHNIFILHMVCPMNIANILIQHVYVGYMCIQLCECICKNVLQLFKGSILYMLLC